MRFPRSLSRDARRLRQARAAIRKADYSIARRLRPTSPGYDELVQPWFVGLMLAAAAIALLDLPIDVADLALPDWVFVAITALRRLA